MNKIVWVVYTFITLFFSSVAFADIITTLEGSGNTKDAVKAFNKAVTNNGGKVDKKNQTKFSSVADFEEALLFKALMFSEVVDKNKVNIRIIVKLPNPDYMSYLTVQSKIETDISKKIYDSMKQDGYH